MALLPCERQRAIFATIFQAVLLAGLASLTQSYQNQSVTSPTTWTAALWQRAFRMLRGPSRTEEEQSMESTFLAGAAKLGAMLRAAAGETRPVDVLCRNATSRQCAPGMITLRTLASVTGHLSHAYPKDLTDLPEVFQREILQGRATAWQHWGSGSWAHKALYAICWQLLQDEESTHRQREMKINQQPQRENEIGNWTFGENWLRMIRSGDESPRGFAFTGAVNNTARHLLSFLGLPNLDGLSFLDLGCGAGLNSLAALTLGAARVVSVDVDQNSLAATRLLREQHAGVEDWSVAYADVLNTSTLEPWLHQFDIVYSYGVLHHTGDTYGAIRNSLQLLRPKVGILYLGLYPLDTQPLWQKTVHRVLGYRNATLKQRRIFEAERLYNLMLIHIAYGGDILEYITWEHSDQRGTDFWTDLRDFLGGWPLDFVETRSVVDFLHDNGMEVLKVGLHGNIEFLAWQKSNSSVAAPLARERVCSKLHGPWKGYAVDIDVRSMEDFEHESWGLVNRSGWFTKLPRWAHSFSDTKEKPLEGRQLMVLEKGRIFGCPHALTREGILASGTSSFSTIGPLLYLFPASGAFEEPNNLKDIVLCKLPHWV